MATAEAPFKEIDIGDYLDRVAEEGVAYIPDFLSEGTLERLQDFCQDIEYYELVREHPEVRERYFKPVTITPALLIELAILQDAIKQEAAKYQDRYPILGEWNPNSHSIQLYDGNSYITSHRDHMINSGLVAVFSVQGEGLFQASKEGDGEPFVSWEVKEGDLLLLRGKNLIKDLSGHPGVFYSISGALTETPRISISFRHNLAGNN